jgi:hypothetical protein
MDVTTTFEIYELNSVLDRKDGLTLKKVGFNPWGCNSFETKQEAIDSLIKNHKTFQEFFILEKVYLTNY